MLMQVVVVLLQAKARLLTTDTRGQLASTHVAVHEKHVRHPEFKVPMHKQA
jgi:hypothetical protein